MTSREKRIEFWDFLTTEKVQRPRGVTNRRLAKVREKVLANDFFWADVIERHGATHMTAVEFYVEENRARSDHSRSNFWSMVREQISIEE
jgi:hypothetical protein